MPRVQRGQRAVVEPPNPIVEDEELDDGNVEVENATGDDNECKTRQLLNCHLF